ncbi:hypothetical protein QFZ52_001056 [Arthrobacter woluwensis]|uniref:hypothetical protein n=1 Tax=Arthrobacter woluwensis TaxID=156980 RepID=UPI00277D6513|nr:hypothetical protein [Arthrobacter woluwensis]MDQ0708404.1 hypothetical protein [Arthrobacter woluwensis]
MNQSENPARPPEEGGFPYYPTSHDSDGPDSGLRLRSTALLSWGIAGTVSGVLAMALSVVLDIARLGLYLVGGGGSSHEFDQQTFDWHMLTGILAAFGITACGFGVVALIVRGARTR